MKSGIAIFVLGILLLGCSTTQQLASYADAGRKIGGGSATMLLRSGRVYDAEQIDVGQDSTKFINSGNDSVMVLPTRAIESFRVTHRGGGALEGLLFGILGGCSAGLLAESGGGWGALYGGMIGGLGGIVIGGLKGHNYIFVLPNDPVDSQLSGSTNAETPTR